METEDDKGGKAGEAGADKGDAGKDKEGGDNRGAEIKALNEGMQAIAGTMGKMQESLSGVTTRLEEIGKPKDKDDGDEGGDSGDRDLEEMSRPQLAQFIVNKTLEAVKKELVEPLKKGLETTTERTDLAAARAAAKESADSHLDFWDWKEELGKIAARHPDLTIEDMYLLARAKDGEKAKKLDEKYKKEPQAEGPKGKGFGGMPPSSGKTVEKTDMAKKDAADSAWEKTMGGVASEEG